jgi:transmembrane sensor
VDLERRLREGPLNVRDVWSAEKTAALSAQVVRLRRRRSLAHGGALLGTVLCGTLVAALWTRDLDPPAQAVELARAAAPMPTAVERQPAVVLGDGSRAEPLDAQSRFEVTRDRPEQVTVVLQRGGARFAVAARAERRFEVESGPVLVRVKGTTFSVTRSDGVTRVSVEDGHVQVFWAGEKAELFAGDAGTFPPLDAPLEPARLGANAVESTIARPTANVWRDLAKKGEYRRAYTAMRKRGTPVSDLPEDHMLAADVARLSGHPQQAVLHLRAVSERFADDPRAPVAAFTLGRVLQDLQRPREAAAAFRRARTLWPRGPLALDAWSGEAEALQDAGDIAAARQIAAGYLERHPSGRHAQAMRALSR